MPHQRDGDLTKIWPHKVYPLIEIGKLELNRNVRNYFAETEQAAFSPGHLVPGNGASPDKMLQAGLLAYPDAHRYRSGANHNQIPVNAPKCPANRYQRDGAMAGMCPAHVGSDNQHGGVNFFPNDRLSEGAPAPSPETAAPPLPAMENAWIKPHDQSGEDYHTQAGDLFRIMSPSERSSFSGNTAGALIQASVSARERMLAQYGKADPLYRKMVEAELALLA